jgi:hypothetical protein
MAASTPPRPGDGPGVTGPIEGAFALARLLAKLPVDVGAVGPDDPLLSVVERVANANGEGPLAAYQDAIRDNPDGPTITALIQQIDPHGAGPRTAWDAGSGCPELPEAARPDPYLAGQAAPWLDTYLTYARSVSPMTPMLFHESGALWLISTVVARRLRVPMPFADIYPNTYAIWIASTTVFHKTTAMAVPRGIARRFFPHLLAPQEVTPEALLSDMAGKEPTKADAMTEWEQALWVAERNFAAQRSLIIDEMSGLMASAGRDYMSGLLEAFLRFYDCEDSYTRSTRSQGRLVIRNAYMSILGASTPRAMAPHIASEPLWSNGFWPRFAMLTPDTAFPTYAKPTNDGPPDNTITWPLEKLLKRLPTTIWPDIPVPLTVSLGPGVFQHWERFNQALSYDMLKDGVDERLYGTYGRMPTQVIKVAMLLAAIDWEGHPGDEVPPPRIELRHLHRAITIAEGWRASAHRALGQSAVADENVRLTRLVRQVGRAGPKGASLRDLGRAMRDVKASEVKSLLELALESDQIREVPAAASTGGRGWPTLRYRVAFT